MDIDELVSEINKFRGNKESFLNKIANSKSLTIYLHEFKDFPEYEFLHALAHHGILHEDEGSTRVYSLFSSNANTRRALDNPEAYFAAKKGAS